ncbi:MAG: SCP2 sterol-binding domain-containing protein [Aquificaceae bacterium]|nr:SCP2 sterol-binding domain-containing protein [Aquificaceae bacterium]MDW8422708.1 SCP2 sterol-binding domain-containing protein [Aquificaceae bacterium]
MFDFLSKEWIEFCRKLIAERKDIEERLRGFGANIKYYVEDDRGNEIGAVELRVENGRIVYLGEVRSNTFDYEIGARLEVWKAIATGEIGPRFALITKKLKFKGSLIEAFKYEDVLEDLISTFSSIPTRWSL